MSDRASPSEPPGRVLAALFGAASLEEAVPLETVALPVWHTIPSAAVADVGALSETPAGPDAASLVGTQWEPALHDFDGLLEFMVSDPYEEVGNALANEGIGMGVDFGDIVSTLGPELVTRRLLCRCIPGLEERWTDLALLVTSALGANGLSLTADPDGAETLLRDEGALVRGDYAQPEDLLAIYTHETRAWRLLTPAEESLLGAWVRDGQYARRWAEQSGSAGDQALATAYQRWSQLWETIAPLQRIPSSPGGWLALFVRTGYARVSDGASPGDEGESADDYSDSDELACLCRVLPDAVLGGAARALCTTGALPGHLPCELPWSLERLMQRGSDAQRALVRHNLRWVMKLAENFGHAIERLDLLQEGNLGLLHTARKFDFRRGFRFSTYATWWIRQAMMRAIADTSLTVRLPMHAFEAARPLVREAWHWPTDAAERFQLLTAGGLEPHQALAVARAMSVEPLDGPIQKLAENLPDECVGEEIDTLETRQALDQVLGTLPEREQRILRLRFGFEDGDPRTLEEVAQMLGGVTRERVRQIESRAIRHLRTHSRMVRLVDIRGYWPEFPEEETKRDSDRAAARKPPRGRGRATDAGRVGSAPEGQTTAEGKALHRAPRGLGSYSAALRAVAPGRWRTFRLPEGDTLGTAAEKLLRAGLLLNLKVEIQAHQDRPALLVRVVDAAPQMRRPHAMSQG